MFFLLIKAPEGSLKAFSKEIKMSKKWNNPSFFTNISSNNRKLHGIGILKTNYVTGYVIFYKFRISLSTNEKE